MTCHHMYTHLDMVYGITYTIGSTMGNVVCTIGKCYCPHACNAPEHNEWARECARECGSTAIGAFNDAGVHNSLTPLQQRNTCNTTSAWSTCLAGRRAPIPVVCNQRCSVLNNRITHTHTHNCLPNRPCQGSRARAPHYDVSMLIPHTHRPTCMRTQSCIFPISRHWHRAHFDMLQP